MMSRAKSEALFAEALKYIPGGVNSPVRAFRGVGGQPFFVNHASGSRVCDVDGNEYVDYVCTWGPAILGHGYPKIIDAVKPPQNKEPVSEFRIPPKSRWRNSFVRLLPSVEKVRMCNSGTEATMSAIRLARGFTKRDKIIKFDGCYHGHVDSLLVNAGSGALTFGHPDSARRPCEFYPAHHRGPLQRRERRSMPRSQRNPGPNRRHYRRTCPRQCRALPAEARISGIPARDHG